MNPTHPISNDDAVAPVTQPEHAAPPARFHPEHTLRTSPRPRGATELQSIRILEIHPVDARRHEDVAAVRWLDLATSETGESSVDHVIDFLRVSGNAADLDIDGRIEPVHVHESRGTRWLQSITEGFWGARLLELPRF